MYVENFFTSIDQALSVYYASCIVQATPTRPPTSYMQLSSNMQGPSMGPRQKLSTDKLLHLINRQAVPFDELIKMLIFYHILRFWDLARNVRHNFDHINAFLTNFGIFLPNIHYAC